MAFARHLTTPVSTVASRITAGHSRLWAALARVAFIIGGLLTLCPAPLSAAPQVGRRTQLFAMDNGVGRGIWSPEKQASTLHDLGYDGITYNYTNPADLKVWLSELGKRNLKLYGIYFGVRLQEQNTLPDGIAEAVELLRGTDAVLWLTVQTSEPVNDQGATAVKRLQEVADLAARANLRVVVYPHFGFHVTTAEQAFDLVVRSGRTNVGLTFNLAHEIAAGNAARTSEIIRHVAPCLAMVSLNGASGNSNPGWDNYIMRLGTGAYDVSGVLKTLAEVHYYGPVAIQFFGLKGDPREILTSTIAAWRKLTGSSSTP